MIPEEKTEQKKITKKPTTHFLPIARRKQALVFWLELGLDWAQARAQDRTAGLGFY
jgi:hypothetical protein